jgi:hypothetical protein
MVKFPTDFPTVPADDDDAAALRLLAGLSDDDTPKANGRPNFWQARDRWRDRLLADSQLSHADRSLVTQIYRHLNRREFENTGKLLAWPSWETMAEGGHLSERSIARGCRKLEELGALRIIHGGRDPRTGWRLKNRYEALLYPGAKLTPSHLPGWHTATCQDGIRLSERDSLIKNAPPSAARRPPNHSTKKKSVQKPPASAWRPATSPQATASSAPPPRVPRGPPSPESERWRQERADDEATLERYAARAASNGGGQ